MPGRDGSGSSWSASLLGWLMAPAGWTGFVPAGAFIRTPGGRLSPRAVDAGGSFCRSLATPGEQLRRSERGLCRPVRLLRIAPRHSDALRAG